MGTILRHFRDLGISEAFVLPRDTDGSNEPTQSTCVVRKAERSDC